MSLARANATNGDEVEESKSGLRLALLIVALIFFAVHGSFSFQGSASESTATSSLSSLQAPERGGFIAYGLIPGIAYSIVLVCIIANGRAVLRLSGQMKLLTALALLTVASSAWSQEPSRSAVFGILYVVDTLFAYYLVAAFSPEQLRKLFLYAGVVIAISSICVALGLPQYGTTHELRHLGSWRGIFGGRTSCAKCLVFLLSAGVSLAPRTKPLHIAYLLLVGLVLVKAFAVTSIIVLAIWACVMLSLAVYPHLETRTARLFLYSAALTAVSSVLGVVFVLPAVLQAFGRDVTFSGRTQVWAAVLPSIWKHPFLGYGFYAFWLGLKGESANAIVTLHWAFGYAHNGILELALQFGILGVVLFFLTLLQALRNTAICLRHRMLPEVHWFISLLLLSCLYNIDEATVVWPNELLSILYIVACCGLAQAARRTRIHEPTSAPRGVRFAHEPSLSPAG